MSSRQIGIQITEEGLLAVQAACAEGGYQLEKAVHLPMQRSTDTLKGCLRRLSEEAGFDRRAGVSVALPYRESLYIRSAEAVKEAGDSESPEPAGDDLPVPGDGAIAVRQRYFNPEHQRMEALISAAPAAAVRGRLEEIRGAKRRCECMDTGGAAVAAAVQAKCEGVGTDIFLAVHEDAGHILIAMAKEGTLFCVRNMPSPPFGSEGEEEAGLWNRFLVREMELTWRSVLSERMAENTPVVLMGGLSGRSDLADLIRSHLGARVIGLDLQIEEKSGASADGYAVAAGMAIRGLHGSDAEGGDFVRLFKETGRRKEEGGQGLRTPVILLVLTGILLAAGIGMRWYRLEREYAALNGAIRQAFVQALPDEMNIVDEAAQLDQRLKEEQAVLEKIGSRRAGAGDAFGVLQGVLACLPDGVTVDSISAGRGEVRIGARGETGESIQEWQKRLEETGMFSGADVRNVQKTEAGTQCEMILMEKEKQGCN